MTGRQLRITGLDIAPAAAMIEVAGHRWSATVETPEAIAIRADGPEGPVVSMVKTPHGAIRTDRDLRGQLIDWTAWYRDELLQLREAATGEG